MDQRDIGWVSPPVSRWLHEQIANSPAAIAAEVVGLIIISGGVVALAYRSPHLTGLR